MQELYRSGAAQVSAMEKLGLLDSTVMTLHIGCGVGRIEQTEEPP
jgi:hypothetical protein